MANAKTPIHFLIEQSTRHGRGPVGPTTFLAACRSTVVRDGEVKTEPTMSFKAEDTTCAACQRWRERSPKCRFCQRPFDPPKPTTRHCRSCHYDGALQREAHLPLMAALERLAEAVWIWHTGGGCFCLAIKLPDGRLVVGTEAVQDTDGTWGPEAVIPDKGQPWALGIYDTEDCFGGGCEHDHDDTTFKCKAPLNNRQLLATVKALIAQGRK